MDSASLLSRESTTLSFRKPQNGHFIAAVQIVTGGKQGMDLRGQESTTRDSSCERLPTLLEARTHALGDGSDGGLQEIDGRGTALSEIARSSSPATRGGNRFFHECAHIEGRAGTLRKHERRGT